MEVEVWIISYRVLRVFSFSETCKMRWTKRRRSLWATVTNQKHRCSTVYLHCLIFRAITKRRRSLSLRNRDERMTASSREKITLRNFLKFKILFQRVFNCPVNPSRNVPGVRRIRITEQVKHKLANRAHRRRHQSKLWRSCRKILEKHFTNQEKSQHNTTIYHTQS